MKASSATLGICNSCRFWFDGDGGNASKPATAEAGALYGACHRSPPTTWNQQDWLFPTTHCLQSCGEHQVEFSS